MFLFENWYSYNHTIDLISYWAYDNVSPYTQSIPLDALNTTTIIDVSALNAKMILLNICHTMFWNLRTYIKKQRTLRMRDKTEKPERPTRSRQRKPRLGIFKKVLSRSEVSLAAPPPALSILPPTKTPNTKSTGNLTLLDTKLDRPKNGLSRSTATVAPTTTPNRFV